MCSAAWYLDDAARTSSTVAVMNRRRLRLVLLYLVLLAAGWLVGKSLLDLSTIDVATESAERVRMVVVLALSAFIVASAIPFVPGLEIGLGLIVIFGARMAVVVYACLVVALTVSFLVGRFVSATRVAALFGHLGLGKARDLVLQVSPLDAQERLDFMTARLPDKWASIFVRYRYLALIFLFNLPGNSVIGGGGGIAFTAGLSGMFSPPAFLLSLALAAIPIPLLVILSERFA